MVNVRESYKQFLQDPRLQDKEQERTPYIPYISSAGREFRQQEIQHDIGLKVIIVEAEKKQGEDKPNITNYLRVEANTDSEGNVTGIRGLNLWRKMTDGRIWCISYNSSGDIQWISAAHADASGPRDNIILNLQTISALKDARIPLSASPSEVFEHYLFDPNHNLSGDQIAQNPLGPFNSGN